MNPGNINGQKFSEQIGKKEARKIEGRRDREKGVWFGLGMIGTVGWSVAIPTLIGAAIGIWLDSRGSQGISWTLTFIFLGLVLGCLNAYYWVKKELNRIRRRKNDE